MGHGEGEGAIRTTWPGAMSWCKYSQVPNLPGIELLPGTGGGGKKERDKNHGSGPAGQAASNKSWGAPSEQALVVACLLACSFSFLASEPLRLLHATSAARCCAALGVGWLGVVEPAPLTRIWASPPGSPRLKVRPAGSFHLRFQLCLTIVPGSHTGLDGLTPMDGPFFLGEGSLLASHHPVRPVFEDIRGLRRWRHDDVMSFYVLTSGSKGDGRDEILRVWQETILS